MTDDELPRHVEASDPWSDRRRTFSARLCREVQRSVTVEQDGSVGTCACANREARKPKRGPSGLILRVERSEDEFADVLRCSVLDLDILERRVELQCPEWDRSATGGEFRCRKRLGGGGPDDEPDVAALENLDGRSEDATGQAQGQVLAVDCARQGSLVVRERFFPSVAPGLACVQIETLATLLSRTHSRSAPSQSCTLRVCRALVSVMGEGVCVVCARLESQRRCAGDARGL